MASTTDLAPGKTTSGTARGAAATGAAKLREEQLEAQISQLQTDLKAIAATLTKLTGEKVEEARGVAKSELHHLKRQGQHLMDDVQEQATDMEKQLKDTIREKPLTAVASAVGIGFILALLTRR